jgi:plasmid stabilization system protein ParE
MSLPIILQPEARVEFDEAYDWYEAQRAGLGDRFVARVQEVFDRISANPKIHRIVFQDVRKGVVIQFPYCVFYREETSCVRVLAVFHARRDPKIWQARAETS